MQFSLFLLFWFPPPHYPSILLNAFGYFARLSASTAYCIYFFLTFCHLRSFVFLKFLKCCFVISLFYPTFSSVSLCFFDNLLIVVISYFTPGAHHASFLYLLNCHLFFCPLFSILFFSPPFSLFTSSFCPPLCNSSIFPLIFDAVIAIVLQHCHSLSLP